ncbi:13170_t:CDS:2 [Cetraspora pellucida]|uniref:13170_t:CDS:1 n=1 Tax=Cetraspora pellucida TaxID=1433469 RepID=A0A9N9JKE1_9GLOM|nr:13170_t:CDS:2 [Cetraspora pellucida]
MLTENQEVVRYDKVGRPSLLFQHPDLHDQIYTYVESGSADPKRRKEVIKVRIIENLCKNLEERYNIYMARTTLNNYLLSRQANSIAAKAHRHPAWVAVAGVSRTDTQEHPDRHYCLASVKIPAVGRTFQTLQSINEPVVVADYDFSVGHGQKLIPSPTGTSSLTHMQDLRSLTLDPQYDDVLKFNEQIKPIWILLVDGGPDENPKHLKNIKVYCQLFKQFDLDYLSVRTHALRQSKYNPVERGMATLSGKLAGITLPVDHFGKHLDSQGKIIDPELAVQNFRYAGEILCDAWSHDLIFGKCVHTQYVDTFTNPFDNLQFEGSEKEMIKELKRQEKQNQINIEKEDEAPDVLFHGLELKITATCAHILLILKNAKILIVVKCLEQKK